MLAKPLTRNQRFTQILTKLNSKPKNGRVMSRSAKIWEKKQRAKLIASNPDLIELFDLFEEVQKSLNLNDREFARELGVQPRMLYYYKSREGHVPSLAIFRRLLELEKLCRSKIVVTKKIISFVQAKPIHHVVIR